MTPLHAEAVVASVDGNAETSIGDLPKSSLVKLLQINTILTLNSPQEAAPRALRIPNLPLFSPPTAADATKDKDKTNKNNNNPGRLERFRSEVQQSLPAYMVPPPQPQK